MPTDRAADTIPFNRPSLVGREIDLIRQAVEGGHTSASGPLSREVGAVLAEAVGGAPDVLLTTSCTAALEMAVTSVLSARGRLVVVANGVYGDRIALTAAAARLPHTVVQSAWTLPPDLEHLAQAIREPDVEAVAVVHHETTTGLRNPIAEVGLVQPEHHHRLHRVERQEHVHVDAGDDAGFRDRRFAGEVARSEQAVLFGSDRGEHD